MNDKAYEPNVSDEAVALIARALGMKDGNAREDGATRLLLDVEATMKAAGLETQVTSRGDLAIYRGSDEVARISGSKGGILISYDQGRSGEPLPIEYRHDEGGWVGQDEETFTHPKPGDRRWRRAAAAVIADRLVIRLALPSRR